MSGYVDHAWRHAPRSQGGTDPIPTQESDNVTGWTVVFGDGETPLVTGDYQAIWKVDRNIVGDGTFNWYIFDPSASVKAASSALDVEIWLYRVRNFGAGTTVAAMLDSPIVIDATTLDSRESASPPVVAQWFNLLDEDGGPNYDSIMVGIDVAGDATGLSINVPIGIERVPGSGYR